MDAARSGISLVIPTFNEAATIEQAVQEADAALGSLFGDFEVLVVDDGSTDDTTAILAHLQLEYAHLRLLHHPVNRGYGAALRTGFAAARFPLVAFTDADCQFDLHDLGPMAKRAADVPIVAGYRVNRQDTPRRRFLSRGYNRLSRALLGTRVRDCDCALKVFRRDVLADLLPESSGFFVNTEMLARARRLGLAVVEVPVTHRPRAGGASKVSLREVPRTLRTLLAFWWREAITSRPAEKTNVFAARVAVNAGLEAVRPGPGRPASFESARPAGPPESRQEAA